MILKKIILNNIRSYESHEIEFSQGSTLLSGDIGSGKTSILLAIEFALFGLQPGQRGSSLLRNGKMEGSVILNFEVDGKEVQIERSLKKSKTVTQDYCAITIDGVKREIAVTELKNQVLTLLDYPKEFAKKQNILYKFTVYTPQEEMKQIILQDPETRVNTLRYVFGIDKYKKILENVSILTGKLREEKRRKEGMVDSLEHDKLSLVEKENELETKHYNLVSVEKELFKKQEYRKAIQEEQTKAKEKIDQKNKFEQEIEKTKLMISTKHDSISNNKKTINQLKEQIHELEVLKFDESQIVKLENETRLSNEEKYELFERNLDISSKINSLISKNLDNENVKGKISKLEVCPTCLQNVDPNYKANVVNKMESDTSENTKQIESLNLEKIKIVKKLNELDSKISEAQKQINELNILKVRLQGINEKQQRLVEIEKSNIALEKDVGLLTQHRESLQKTIFEFNKYENLFQEKQRQLEEALKEERQADIKVAELKKEIDMFSKSIQELKDRIQKSEETKKRLDYLSGLESWLSLKFSPLISFIERNVMAKLKSEFSTLFNEWFLMLVSDNFNVRLDDDFTPIIEQQDYELNYTYLSGGERTAIALAYRLALNQVINSLLSKIKTKDLVILDEPTDGFSDAQLDKMRDVLQELNVAQLIIVSHEQKIESFVENVIKFKKENGVSGRGE